MHDLMTRRKVLQLAGAAALAGLAPRVLAADSPNQRYKIAAADIMLIKRQKLGAVQLARDCGCDGLEVDMGPLNQDPTFNNELLKPEVRKQFLDASKNLGIEFCSLSMSGFFAQSFPKREIDRPVQDCIDTMKLMDVKVAFLPMGVQGDLVKFPELRAEIVKRLKSVAARAEKAGVIIGIETALDAAGEVKLLDDIGSASIRSYFNFSNALQNSRDLYTELKTLGKERICQIHCTDQDGVWLQNDPKIDVPKARRTLDEMGWSGWLVMERSRDAKKSGDVKYNFGANAKYLKSIFQA